jgi:competence protein ComEA
MWISKIIGALLLFFTLTAWAAVDINSASADDLTSIKGIGPGTSTKILDQRKKGKFKNWDDVIERVSGIGEARAGKLSQEGLTVNGDKYKGAISAKQQQKPTATKEKRVSSASKDKQSK